ncbi:hypothetical protein [Fimbriiglobus ruber]|uniref:Uncharacterized protein n=1 Tax=Fimbriiglobus ruber TaxID=1908690 RepID=A0A225DAW8_9BACT|nr:hypothetical protein [Fimbriiglobus ruber]OWK38612.1 hypothetical protein FRUB_07732 [Fimbriiglobus ruber]
MSRSKPKESRNAALFQAQTANGMEGEKGLAACFPARTPKTPAFHSIRETSPVNLDYERGVFDYFRVRWMYGHSPGSFPNLMAISAHKLREITSNIPGHPAPKDNPLKGKLLSSPSPLLILKGYIVSTVDLGAVCKDGAYSGSIGVFQSSVEAYTEANATQIIRWSFELKNGGVKNSTITLEETGLNRGDKAGWASKALRLIGSSSVPPWQWQQPFPYRKPGE